MAHYVVYIPGLSDHKGNLQYEAVQRWERHGVRVLVQRMNWNDKRSFKSKLARIIADIDELHKSGNSVSLVGVSAGASAAINAFAARRHMVKKVVCICGKLENLQTVKPKTFLTNPSFRESLVLLADSLLDLASEDRKRIMSIHPIYDDLVPVADTRIEGAIEKTLPVIGHSFGIMWSIVFSKRTILNFIKENA